MARSHQWSRENKAKTWAQHRQTIPQCFSVTCIGWREIRPMSFEIMNQLLIQNHWNCSRNWLFNAEMTFEIFSLMWATGNHTVQVNILLCDK